MWLGGYETLKNVKRVCEAKWVLLGWVMCEVPRPVERLVPRTFGYSLSPCTDSEDSSDVESPMAISLPLDSEDTNFHVELDPAQHEECNAM